MEEDGACSPFTFLQIRLECIKTLSSGVIMALLIPIDYHAANLALVSPDIISGTHV